MGGTRWPVVAKRSRLELTRDSSRWLQIAPHKKLHFPDGVEQEFNAVFVAANHVSRPADTLVSPQQKP